MPGVYTHKDWKNASTYARWYPMFNDGAFWSIIWELCGDPWSTKTKNGQTVFPETKVYLNALWVGVRDFSQMERGVEVSYSWRPELEANPWRMSL